MYPILSSTDPIKAIEIQEQIAVISKEVTALKLDKRTAADRQEARRIGRLIEKHEAAIAELKLTLPPFTLDEEGTIANWLTNEIPHMVAEQDLKIQAWQEAAQADPIYAMEWRMADCVAAIETKRLINGLLYELILAAQAESGSETDYHMTLTSCSKAIQEYADDLTDRIMNDSVMGSTSPSSNAVELFKQAAQKEFTRRTLGYLLRNIESCRKIQNSAN